MPDDKTIIIPRRVECRLISCKFHKKQARYEIKWYANDDLAVINCIECNPPQEVVRFSLRKEEKPNGPSH